MTMTAEMPVVDVVHRAREITQRAKRAQVTMDEINRDRREVIARLMREGLRQSEVARLLDISRQRVGQYVDELRAAGELPPACHDEDAPADE